DRRYQETDQYDFIHVGTVASHRPIENRTMMIYEKSSDGREGHEQAALSVRYVPLTDKEKQ
ncbi:unnamed protein product, partial [Rotaria magnacalcarata]